MISLLAEWSSRETFWIGLGFLILGVSIGLVLGVSIGLAIGMFLNSQDPGPDDDPQ